MPAQIDAAYLRTRPWKLWSRMLGYLFFEGRPLTTRGQWVNPLVFGLFALEKRLPALRRVTRPVFILGTGRSGTTILGIVMSMHRDAGFLNEPKALWHAVHPGEDLIGSYTRDPATYRLGAADATPRRVRDAHRLFGAYLALSGSRRMVDKYPELIFRVPFVKALFPDAKFLFLVRNGWDTCRSIDCWSDRLGSDSGDETHDWWGADGRKWQLILDQLVPEHADLAAHAGALRGLTNQTDMAALEWVLTMREGLALQQTHPDDVLRVDYEALCDSPRRQLTEILQFCELAVDDATCLDYAERTLTGNPPREPFALHEAVSGPFADTMNRLGYPCGRL